MKNKVLFIAILIVGAMSSACAQTIPDYSFENWLTDTNYLDLTITTPPTLDTAVSYNPQFWTTVNEVTNGHVFGHKILVTQSSTAYSGSSAIQLTSDTLKATLTGVPVVGTLNLDFVCPGFAVCGNFPINLSSFVSLGSQFNPALLPGAGIPVSARYSKIGGYMKYSPVGGDSAYVVAVLRQGTTVVATATYTRSTTDAAYSYFEAPFVYQNCLLPDTMVYTISSGNPYSISGVALGNASGLHQGSSVLVDSIFLGDSIVYGIAYPLNDSVHTTINTPIHIGVLAGDSSCDGAPVSLDSVFGAGHGTAVISGDSVIYTPSAGFSGMDTFYYVVSVGTGPDSTAEVVVNVSGFAAGISEVAESKTSIYPNPASTKLYVSNSNSAVTGLRVCDMLGNVVRTESISSAATVDVSALSNGLYIIQFSGNDGKTISSSRFVVVR